MSDLHATLPRLLRFALALACLLAACAAPPQPARLALYASLPLAGEAGARGSAVLAGFQSALAANSTTVCAGRYTLRLVALNNTTEGMWDATLEAAAANKAATDPEAVAFLGSFEPGPLLVSLPILNQAGPMLVVAPMNTYPPFTFASRRAGAPREYYPDGRRNLLRLGPTDYDIGAGAARWAQQAGASTVFLLYDQYDPTLQGLNVARGFETAAAEIGLQVVGSLGIDRFADEFDSVMYQVEEQGGGALPALLVYAGPPVDHLGLLFAAKSRWLGDARQLPVLAAPGFAAEAFAQAAGPDAAGTFVITPALPEAEWPGEGREFAESAGAVPGIDALYGYGAARHILASIEAVCAEGMVPTRRAVLRQALTRPPAPLPESAPLPPVWGLPAPNRLALYRVTGGALDFREIIAGE